MFQEVMSFEIGGLLFFISSVVIQHAVRMIILPKAKLEFLPFNEKNLPAKTIVVDCTHTSAEQITHHLKLSGQRERTDINILGDSSTQGVLNALAMDHKLLANKRYVTSNHFDIDSFLSVWSCINQELALKKSTVLEAASLIGDFREFVVNNSTYDKALKLVCWINKKERNLFYKPFESKISRDMGEEDSLGKFKFFLEKFEAVLNNCDAQEHADVWLQEYHKVIKGCKTLFTYDNITLKYIENVNKVTKYKDLGLVVVRDVEPLHYYTLFSISKGFDIVLSLFEGNRYELETKYTTMVDLRSRGVLPRIDFTPLSKYLNEVEGDLRRKAGLPIQEDLRWCANSITDSGPLMRLDKLSAKLTKSERYGQPYERPIFPSVIASSHFENIIVSYVKHAFTGGGESCPRPKRDWEWSEYHSFNKSIDWAVWLDFMRKHEELRGIKC